MVSQQIQSEELALLCAKIADDHKAKDVIILKVAKLFVIADYFVICSGLTVNHSQAIANEIEFQLGKRKIHYRGKEGYTEGKWILMDYGDVIVHVYLEDVRDKYDLESLWGDAPHISLPMV